jgi:primosomal protein N' (replication factor Y)
MSKGFAKVALATPLPQLDRLFEYRIAESLGETIAIGCRVRVPFGRSKQLIDGFVVEIADAPEYQGELAELSEVVSSAPVLKPEVYRLCRAIADRQAVAIGDVLRLAIADRSVAVEKGYLAERQQAADTHQFQAAEPAKPGSRSAILVEPRLKTVGAGRFPAWVALLLEQARKKLSLNQSSILVVPDFRDQHLLLEAAKILGLDAVVNYSTELAKSKRYSAFLDVMSQKATVVIGSRAAVYAPSHDLGLIAIWDDGDTNHLEPTSPYIHSREVALIRQSQLANCDLLIASHSRSAEVQRLIEIGYLLDQNESFDRPKIAVSHEGFRIDGLAYKTIREGLKTGPVLIQVGAKGNSVSVFCEACSARALCKDCNGPLWVDSKGAPKCRWCNAFNLDFKCRDCGGRQLNRGQAGATRTATELAKTFAPVKVIESTGDVRIEKVDAKPALVIATPGAEPLAAEGYAAVVLLDCQNLLARDNLRATEDAVRLWSNAFALMAESGKGVAVGIAGEFGQKLAFWQQAELAAAELASRRELAFAPSVRMASVTATRETLDSVKTAISGIESVKVLGPLASKEPELMRILVRYDYSAGAALASELRAQVLLHGASGVRVSPKNGRASRPIRIKMDEPEVI